MVLNSALVSIAAISCSVFLAHLHLCLCFWLISMAPDTMWSLQWTSFPSNTNITLQWSIIIIATRPKPPSGRQGLAGSWGKDTVRQVHYKMFSTSHFAPTALSSNWILLFKCGYKNSLVITKIFYFLLSTFYFLSEDKPLQTNKQTDRPFKKVIIFRDTQTNTHFIIIYISPSSLTSVRMARLSVGKYTRWYLWIRTSSHLGYSYLFLIGFSNDFLDYGQHFHPSLVSYMQIVWKTKGQWSVLYFFLNERSPL